LVSKVEHPARSGREVVKRPVQVHPTAVTTLIQGNQRRRSRLERQAVAPDPKQREPNKTRRRSTDFDPNLVFDTQQRRGDGPAPTKNGRRRLTHREASR
jgi:hypothetical protein